MYETMTEFYAGVGLENHRTAQSALKNLVELIKLYMKDIGERYQVIKIDIVLGQVIAQQ